MTDLTRRTVLTALGASGAAACAANGSAPLASASTPRPAISRFAGKPNILFILTDQEMGVTNYPESLLARMPGHQQLLARGTHLTNYNVHTTPCSPSRSNIYTGQHTQKTKVYQNSNDETSPSLPYGMPTLGHMLEKAGYYTAYKGKWHLSSINGERNWNQEVRIDYPMTTDALKRYGFSDYGFDGESVGLTWAGHIDDVGVAADAGALIKEFADGEKTGGKPWFLAVNYVNPHDIMFFDATGKQAETRRLRNMLSPVKGEPGHPLYGEDLGLPLPRSFYTDDLSTKPEAHRAINQSNNPAFGELPRSDEASWLRFRNYYFNCIRDVDQHVETLLWALEVSGQLDNTIIVYTADHGERAGAHGMRQKGGTIYREETNVPMIISHPDVAGGKVSSRLMGAVDIAPTLLGLAGKDASWTAEHFPDLVGVDVSPVVASPTMKTARDDKGHLFNFGVNYFWARHRDGSYDLSKRRLHRGVYDGRFKFARYFSPDDHHMPDALPDLLARNDLELYDTQADPDEVVNLAQRPDEVAGDLERLNKMTNNLVRAEVGRDEGQEYEGLGGSYKFTRA